MAQSKIIPLQASNRLQLPKIIPGQRKSTGAPEPKFKGKTQVFGQSTGADDLENGKKFCAKP